jgi:hypothetical protein
MTSFLESRGAALACSISAEKSQRGKVNLGVRERPAGERVGSQNFDRCSESLGLRPICLGDVGAVSEDLDEGDFGPAGSVSMAPKWLLSEKDS